MTRGTMTFALVMGLSIAPAAHAQTAGTGSVTGTAQQQGVTAAPATGTVSPKTAPVKPGQTLQNGPNAATGVSGSGNAGAGGGVAPGAQ